MNKTEKIAFDQLRVAGYQVEQPINKTRMTGKGSYFTIRHDLWGMWDFCAVNKKEVRFIQVSEKYMSQKPKPDQLAMISFPNPPHTKKEYWRWDKKTRSFIIELIKGKVYASD